MLHRYDEKRPCPKCHWAPVPTRFCQVTVPGGYLSRLSFHPFVPEGGHMHRECGRCGYGWIELAKDTPLMAERTRRERIAAMKVKARATFEHFEAKRLWP